MKLAQPLKQWILLVLLFGLLLIVSILYRCVDSNSCANSELIMYLTFRLLNPLKFFSEGALIGSLVVVFINKEIFNSWLKFCVYFIPVTVIILAIVPAQPAPATFIDIFPYYRADFAEFFGILFSLGTIILVLWKYFKSRRNSKPTES